MLHGAGVMHTLPFKYDARDGCQRRPPLYQICLGEKQTKAEERCEAEEESACTGDQGNL